MRLIHKAGLATPVILVCFANGLFTLDAFFVVLLDHTIPVAVVLRGVS